MPDRSSSSRLPPGVPLFGRLRLAWHELSRGKLSADKALGFIGEDAAARFLRRAGFRLMARNVMTPEGEADLVCRAPDGQTVVIVEVKTRRVRGEALANPGSAGAPAALGMAGATSRTPYPPELSVHAEKRRKLVAIARHLSNLNGWGRAPVRIDVVAIEWPDSGAKPEIRHWIDAVR